MSQKNHQLVDIHALNEYFLHPGYLHIVQDQGLITTLLGSCVGVAIVDPIQKIGGLNHFLLPEPLFGEKSGNRFGVFAIPELVSQLLKAGASRKYLQAKIYGGSSQFCNDIPKLDVGQNNILIARKILRAMSIPIIEENVGGTVGRRICLDVSNFQVQHRFIA